MARLPACAISIHALLAESDPGWAGPPRILHPFQSTLSLRRATSGVTCSSQTCFNFNPRSPCGERRVVLETWLPDAEISIHALLAESDLYCSPAFPASMAFQSTLSLRRATGFTRASSQGSIFQSTLSLRRATRFPMGIFSVTPYFNPRSPCGERPFVQTTSLPTVTISIHALLAESDFSSCLSFSLSSISIHALLAESDGNGGDVFKRLVYFNPRSPCGERPLWTFSSFVNLDISIHALLAESDDTPETVIVCELISIHALLAESDGRSGSGKSRSLKFQSTLSLRRATHIPAKWASRPQNFNPRSPCGERRFPGPSNWYGVGNFNPRSPCGERRRCSNEA